MNFFPLDLRNGGLKETVMQPRTGHTCWVGAVSVVVPVWMEGLAGSPDEGRGEREDRGKRRRAEGVCACRGEPAGLSSANGNANGIYGPNLQSTNSSRVGVNHFNIKIYVLRAKD